jgi:AbrB family looped-hinge helix DNA binding protein
MSEFLVNHRQEVHMPRSEVGRVGRRGTLVIPARLRAIFGLEEGADVVMEATPDGILVRPAAAVPIEIYGPERRAEFLMSTAVDAADYEAALAEVRLLGVDPKDVPHRRPDA